MDLQLIRNATLKLRYGGATILVDPYLAPKLSLESFAGKSNNPMVDLPQTIEDILSGVDLVVVSHLHSDHFDDVAKQKVAKHLPLICQPGDEGTIRQSGFLDVTPLVDELTWQGITFRRCEGSHGLGPVLEDMGPVIGFTIEATDEPTIYWAGDTVFYPPVANTIERVKPDIIVTHSCGARWDGDLIVMDAAQTLDVCAIAPPGAIVVATHMEALDHATVDRKALRAAASQGGIPAGRLLIPADGETLRLPAKADA